LALQSILLSKAIFEKENNAERLASVYCLLGFYHYKMKDYQEAINNFNKTLNFDLDSYAKKEMIIIEAYWGISQSYKKLNRVSKAYSYFQKYVVLKDKLYRSEKYNAILKVQSSFETKEKEKEINLLKKKALKEEQEKNKQKKYSIVIISLLVLVVILLIYLFALRKEDFKKKTLLFEQTDTLNKLLIENKDIENKRLLIENKELEAQEELNKLREEKLRADLEYGQRKLSATAMQVIGKNEMLSNLKKSLENLMNKKTKPDKVISDLVREIDNNIDLDKDWNNFKLHFEEVHQGFFFRLIEKYNDLTVDELKLCAYLKINLSSKEIAQILNITPVAVNKRRNRLRKKVNLDGTEDLFSFLNKV